MSIPKNGAKEEGQSNIASEMKEVSKDAQFRHDVYNHIAKYSHANDLVAFWNLFITYILIAVCYLYPSVWLFPIAAFVRVRIFIVFHDCAHQSYFSKSYLNYWIGQLTSFSNFTSYSFWKKGHDHHHKVLFLL